MYNYIYIYIYTYNNNWDVFFDPLQKKWFRKDQTIRHLFHPLFVHLIGCKTTTAPGQNTNDQLFLFTCPNTRGTACPTAVSLQFHTASHLTFPIGDLCSLFVNCVLLDEAVSISVMYNSYAWNEAYRVVAFFPPVICTIPIVGIMDIAIRLLLPSVSIYMTAWTMRTRINGINFKRHGHCRLLCQSNWKYRYTKYVYI